MNYNGEVFIRVALIVFVVLGLGAAVVLTPWVEKSEDDIDLFVPPMESRR